METLDLSEALDATEGDVDLLRDVIAAFFEEVPGLLAEIDSSLQSGDVSSVRRASHTIKGTLRIFGDVPPRELARQLEQIAQSGTLVGTDAKRIFVALNTSLDDFRQRLDRAMQQLE